MEEKIDKLQTVVPGAVNHLLIVPKLFRLLLALFRDPRVPKYLKILTAGAVFYVALPFDILPDFVPVAGFVDELIVILLILIQYMKSVPPEVFLEHWNREMGDDFDLEAGLKKAMDELAPQVGDRFAWLRAQAQKLVEKVDEYVSRGRDDEKGPDQLPAPE